MLVLVGLEQHWQFAALHSPPQDDSWMLTCMIYFLLLQKENPSFSQGDGHQNLMLWKKHPLTLREKTCKAVALLFMKECLSTHL